MLDLFAAEGVLERLESGRGMSWRAGDLVLSPGHDESEAWLAPIQAMILPISEKQHAYAEALRTQLSEAGFRVEANLRNEKIGLKIREAEKSKIPYMLVVGDREVQSGTVSVRGRNKADLGSMAVPNLLDMLRADMTQPSGRS